MQVRFDSARKVFSRIFFALLTFFVRIFKASVVYGIREMPKFLPVFTRLGLCVNFAGSASFPTWCMLARSAML